MTIRTIDARGLALRAIAAVAMLASAPAVAAEGTSDRLMAAQGQLASRLIDNLAGKGAAANVVVSPASLAGALAAVDLGADDALRRSLHQTLGFPKSPAATADFDALRKATGRPRENGALSSANAVVFDRSVAPFPNAIEALTRAGIRATVEDFGKPETLAGINAWVAERTKGKIPTILDQLPRNAGLVALNALYFKDRWKQPFVAAETKPAPFRLVGGRTVEAPLMRAGDRRFRFRQDARFVAVELAYATEGLSMIVVTTRRDPAPAKDFAKLGGWLAGEGFAESPGEVALPRFNGSANIDLMPALKALGLQPQTTLPGFSREPLSLAKAQQRVELKVDEEGAEAAAATAVVATRSAAESEFVKLTADKPFIFALRDSESGLILLAGYVANPQSNAAQASETPASGTR
jgi:serpin B